jgi:hypothetical protein
MLLVELFHEEYWQHDPQTVANESKAKTLAACEGALQSAS